MKPEDEKNYPDVVIPKVWEEITEEDGQKRHHLVTKEVSDYIRILEYEIEVLNRLLADKLKEIKTLTQTKK